MIKDRIRNAVKRAANGSGLTRAEFAERAEIPVPTLFAYMSEGATKFRTPSIESVVKIALASEDPDAFMLSLLPPDARRAEWAAADRAEALAATESMARETAQALAEAKRDDEAFSKLHTRFAACYLMAYDARVRALREGKENE